MARANEYGENPARQLRWIKQLITQNAAESDIAVVPQREMALLKEAYASPEHAAVVQAFMDKLKA